MICPMSTRGRLRVRFIDADGVGPPYLLEGCRGAGLLFDCKASGSKAQEINRRMLPKRTLIFSGRSASD